MKGTGNWKKMEHMKMWKRYRYRLCVYPVPQFCFSLDPDPDWSRSISTTLPVTFTKRSFGLRQHLHLPFSTKKMDQIIFYGLRRGFLHTSGTVQLFMASGVVWKPSPSGLYFIWGGRRDSNPSYPVHYELFRLLDLRYIRVLHIFHWFLFCWPK
jgi:hypothetical protein